MRFALYAVTFVAATSLLASMPATAASVILTPTSGKQITVDGIGVFTPISYRLLSGIGGGFTLKVDGTVLPDGRYDPCYFFNNCSPLPYENGAGYQAIESLNEDIFNASDYGGVQHVTFTLSPTSGGTVLVNLIGNALPEPATWAMMIAGFGVIGFAMRSRSSIKATVRFA